MKFKLIYFFFASLTILFIACQSTAKEQGFSKSEQDLYLKKGQEIALKTFATLGGQLQTAMKKGGVPHAINYCKLNAFPLVDSLSEMHQATIRRVSFKARNPLDIPNEEEALVLRKYEENFQRKHALAPMVKVNKDESISFFAPIQTNAFCLQCHGKVGETLKEEDYALIKERYPEDKAIGYVEGDLRGMWSIAFKSIKK